MTFLSIFDVTYGIKAVSQAKIITEEFLRHLIWHAIRNVYVISENESLKGLVDQIRIPVLSFVAIYNNLS